MQVWMILEFAFALAATISCIALILGELHLIERVEKEQWLNQLKERVEAIPRPSSYGFRK
jgi:hypothetical protein